MYLSAQRVVSPAKGEGVNAYYNAHDQMQWSSNSTLFPEANPGTLQRKHEEIPPPGNRVRSYLDVVAPESDSLARICSAFEHVLAGEQPEDFRENTVKVGDHCWFRFGMELPLAKVWRQELRSLFDQAIDLVSQSPSAK